MCGIAGILNQLLDSPAERHQLGKNGKRLVNCYYAWKAIAKNLVAVYTTILEQDHHHYKS
jgi:glycosyltransferase involved in cell wall biosynthesis